MSISTKTTETLNGITYGLSDTCATLATGGNWTASELARFSWCRYTDKYINCMSTTTIDVSQQQGSAVLNLLSYFNHDGGGYLKTKYVDDKIATVTPYAFNILMYGNGVDFVLNSSNASNFKVVTSCSDFQKLYVKVDEYTETDYSVDFPVARTIKRNDLDWSSYGVYNSDNDLYTDYIQIWTVLVIDEETFFVTRGIAFPGRTPCLYDGVMGAAQYNLRPSNYISLSTYPEYDEWYYQYGDVTTYDGSKHLLRWYKNGLSIPDSVTWDDNDDKSACWDVDSEVSVFMCGYWGRYNYTYFLRTENAVKNAIAYCGLRWRYENGDTTHIYTPIIVDGFITGWSTDPDVETELNDVDDVTGNNISPYPPTPPTPSGDEDDIDSMGFDGMSCNVGGPAKYYIMSYSDIHHLIGDFNAHAEAGTSISNNIISCYVNALDWNWSTGSEAIQIYSGGAQTTAFTSDMNYSVLTGYNARDIIGSIDVPRMTNTFYDFSPYSTYEVYVPFCGWVALPDTVAGRHIKIYFETDEATCGCKGRVFFVDSDGNGVTVAEITGSFGAPCPIQVIEGGLYKQAMLSNGLQVIGGIASGVMGGASGSGVLAVGGLNMAMQSLGNCLIAGNTNYGQTIGRAGDASGLMCAGKPYLKITYPPIDEVVNNSMFAHTVGYLCNTVGQLNGFHGFTVCANPHIHISATSSEKEEIKQLLEQGVILP